MYEGLFISNSKDENVSQWFWVCCFKFIPANDTITLTFSLKQMTLGKETIDNNVYFVPIMWTNSGRRYWTKHDRERFTS